MQLLLFFLSPMTLTRASESRFRASTAPLSTPVHLGLVTTNAKTVPSVGGRTALDHAHFGRWDRAGWPAQSASALTP